MNETAKLNAKSIRDLMARKGEMVNQGANDAERMANTIDFYMRLEEFAVSLAVEVEENDATGTDDQCGAATEWLDEDGNEVPIGCKLKKGHSGCHSDIIGWWGDLSEEEG